MIGNRESLTHLLSRAIHYSISDGVSYRSVCVAIVVGTILNLINQGDAILEATSLNWIKLRALCRQYLWSRFLPAVETTNMSACYPSVSVQSERDGCVVLDSIITCPHCGSMKSERMPVDACQIVYECIGCVVQLRPKAGDCCVFCSYGSVRCPPIQVN